MVSIRNDILWSYVLIAFLIILGVYFTVKTNFVQIRMLREMIRLLGDGLGDSSKKKQGVSSSGAFCLGTATRVGNGNLASIAIAITVGGPETVFWMWVIALLGSASAFAEGTLAQIYKIRYESDF